MCVFFFEISEMEKSEDTSEQAASGPGEKVKYLFYISCIYDDES